MSKIFIIKPPQGCIRMMKPLLATFVVFFITFRISTIREMYKNVQLY